MMTKVRLGHLMVLATVWRMLNWPARARRVLCGDEIETVQHFVSDCKFEQFLAPVCRARMRWDICSALPFVGEAGSRRLN
jgi:hypothetical protein